MELRMASLAQTLQQKRAGVTKRGLGGQLSQETTEEVQSLAGQAGLQAPPINAIATGQIGGTAKQQDMAGSKAQKTAALSLSNAPVESGLAAAMRRGQSRTEMTTEEQAQTTKSKDMQDLGSLGDRVTSFIDAQRQALQAQADTQAPGAQTQPGLDVAAATTFQGKDVSQIKSLLSQYRASPGDMNILLALNTALGYDVKKQLSPQEVDQLYESATDTIARGVAGNVDNDLTVEDLAKQAQFGYTPEQLSGLLGVPADQVSKMSVAQLRSQIQKVGYEEFAKTQELEQKAQSGQLGQAERQLARQAAAEASSTGVRATEADYGNMEQQIQNADKVTFGGKEYDVENLLKDETISGLIQEYMNSAPGSPLRTQLEKTEPALLAFINKNQAVLADASTRMQAGATEFKAVQESNKNLINAVPGVSLSPEIAAKLIPGFGTLQAARIDPNSVPLLSVVSEMPTQARKQAAINVLNTASEKYTDIPNELAGLSRDEIARLSLGKEDAPFSKYLKARELRDTISSAPDQDTLVGIAFGEIPASFAQKQLEVRKNSAFGVPSGLPIDISDVGNLKSQLLNATPPTSLKQASTGNIPAYQKVSLGSVSVPLANTPEGYWRNLAGDLANDGNLDANDVEGLIARENVQDDVGLKRVIKLEDIANKSGAKIDKGAVTSGRQALTDKNTAREIALGFKSGEFGNTWNSVISLMDRGANDSRLINSSIVREEGKRALLSELNNGVHGQEIVDLLPLAKSRGIWTSEMQRVYDKSWEGTPLSPEQLQQMGLSPRK